MEIDFVVVVVLRAKRMTAQGKLGLLLILEHVPAFQEKNQEKNKTKRKRIKSQQREQEGWRKDGVELKV